MTLLLTDVESSTRLWQTHPQVMPHAISRQRELIESAVAEFGGVLPRDQGEGDSVLAAFARAASALQAASRAQQALSAEAWPGGLRIRVRAAVLTGEPELVDGNYLGITVNRCARLRAVSWGGQTVVSAATAEAAADGLPSDLSLVDRGVVRLKDLSRPEHVYELFHPGREDDFPPLRSLDAARHNLPVQLTSFVGREADLEMLREAVAGARLVTLIGAGGCGKTRLACQAAAELLTDDADPIGAAWLAQFASLSDPGLVPLAIASAVGVREQPGRPIDQTIAESLGDGPALLVLDNCEHVLDAAAQSARGLLTSSSTVTVLATSRRPLGLRGEHVFHVDPLATPSASDAAGRSASVRLFVDRARLVRPGFALSDENGLAVSEICTALDGIPLAIELAASRVRVLSPSQIKSRLGDRFRFLRASGPDVLPRHETLGAAIEWSHDLLDQRDQILFRRLAVFAGSFSLEAAESVCAEPPDAGDVVEGLFNLADHSLVVVDEDEAGDVSRFRLLETIRAFATERLEAAGEDEIVGSRHLDWARQLASDARDGLRRGEQQRWLAALTTELDNLRRALDQALGAGLGEQAAEVFAKLEPFWSTTGRWSEGRAWLDRLLSSGLPLGEHLAACLVTGGRLAYAQGDYAACDGFHSRALREHPVPMVRSAALAGRAAAALGRGDLDEATSRFEECVRDARASDNPTGVMVAYSGLGMIAVHRERFDEAERHYSECLAFARESRDDRNMAVVLMNLGAVHMYAGRLEESRRCSEEGLEKCKKIGAVAGIGEITNNLGMLDYCVGDLDGAARRLEECVRLSEEIGDLRALGNALSGLGYVKARRGHVSEATASHERALSIRRRLQFPQEIADSLIALGEIEIAFGDPAAAEPHLQEALDLIRDEPSPTRSVVVSALLASVHVAAADYPRAIDALEGMDQTLDRPMTPTARPRALVAVARAQLGVGQTEQARRHLVSAIRDAYGRGQRLELLDALETLATADALASADDDHVSVDVLAAADAHRAAHDVPRLPRARDGWERACHVLRDRLGDGFVAAWQGGAVRTIEEAAERALSAAEGSA